MITMTELAKLAGVSQPTVSRVLNGNTSVNPEVAKKVMDCVKKYNYHPNRMARGLSAKKTFLLAVMVPNISNPFFAEVIESIEKEAEDRGYSVLIFNSNYDEKKEQKCLQVIQQYCVDGLLFAPIYGEDTSADYFEEMTIPKIMITNHVKDMDSVYISLEKAGYMVARHLLSLRIKKYVFVGERKDYKFIGFEKCLRENGVDLQNDLSVFWEKDHDKMLRLLAEYLKETGERTGIFALNDMEALVILNTLMSDGIPVPEKAALVGFDNTFLSRQLRITSVNQPINQMCKIAVDWLLTQEKGEKGHEVRHFELVPELIIRESSEH